MQKHALLPLAALLAGFASAQSNTVPGLDGRLDLVDNLTHQGHRGTFPNGEEGMSMSNRMCNPGSVNIPWFAAMQPNHPKFGFLIMRESGGRMVQISDRSYCKHAFTSASVSGNCGTCDGTGGNQMGLRCSDTYGANHNASQTDLGPPDELDPWLGTWNPVGSYFDRGDPDVGPPGNSDGSRSLTSAVGFDSVKNRVTVKDSDLNVAGARYFYGIHLMHAGEAAANRGDNLASRGFTPTWNGSSWSFANNAVGQVWGSILQHWTGATLGSARNGNDDGSFTVAVVVTPIAGGFHYEYALHNIDNNRGGAVLRIPINAGGTASNFGFRDIDGNALNDWTAARVGNEIVFSAGANNALNWNSIYNFWFDCSEAPSNGLALVDEARVGPGTLTVSVPARVPSNVPTATNTIVGTGCAGAVGACQNSVYEFFSPGSSFDLANSSWELVRNGNDYHLGTASGAYVAPTGSTLTLGDDDTVAVTLPFSMPIPGGTTTQIWVCSNGFVAPVDNGTSYQPSASGMLGGSLSWNAAWHDFNPNGGGAVRVDSSPTAVRITYLAIANFSGAGTSTFQYRFLPNGTVSVYYQNMAVSADACLVGYSPGGGANDPGASNLTTVIPAGLLLSSCLAPLSLSADVRPVLGTTVTTSTTNVPAGSPIWALIYSVPGSSPPIDLTSAGMAGCFLYTAPVFTTFAAVGAPGSTVNMGVSIPNNPSFVSVAATFQAITYSPPLTPFGWLTSNGLVMLLAAQ